MPRKTPPCRPGYERDRSGFNEAAARCRGKLPPAGRRIPAELPGFNEAAARCRGKHPPETLHVADLDASMRPRPDAAENGRGRRRTGQTSAGFNEAAARCRGKQPSTCASVRGCVALQ